MSETQPKHIDPATMITKIAEQKKPSAIGLPRRQMVSVGETQEGQTYVHIGGIQQISHHLDAETRRDGELMREITVFDIFRWQQDGPSESLLEGTEDTPRTIKDIQASIADGQELIEGEFTVITRPDTPSIRVPDKKGIWAPVNLALGQEWILK